VLSDLFEDIELCFNIVFRGETAIWDLWSRDVSKF